MSGVLRIRVVVMQKDEAELLLAWLEHYGNLFGYRNLTIVDNGSVDAKTLSILHHAARLGCVVETRYGTQADYDRKGDILADIIRGWDATLDYDFALPVDCDELLAVFENDRLSIDREEILREMARHLGTQESLRIDMSLFNVPGHHGWYSPDRAFHKGYLPARTIQHLDHGHHAPVSRFTPRHTSTRLTYLHNHNHPYDAYMARTRAKLPPEYRHLTDRATLQRLGNDSEVMGNHLFRALLRSREEYDSLYDQHLRIRMGDFWSGAIRLADGQGEILWNADTYLALHPDVVRHEQGPLHHFVRFGWPEGREIGPLRAPSAAVLATPPLAAPRGDGAPAQGRGEGRAQGKARPRGEPRRRRQG